MNFKTHGKLTIGLTGGILCGKSAALAAWKQAGVFGLSCDELVQEISSRPTVHKKILALLGTADRAELAKQVFSCEAARRKLENLLHPLVQQEIARQLKQTSAAVRVIEVPLLFEAGWQDLFDVTVVITAPTKVLATRAKKRHMSRTDFLNRSRAQLSQTEKAARADICLVNAGSPADLTCKIKALHQALVKFIS